MFHSPKFWSKAVASRNIHAMLVTFDTFHPLKSSLNAVAPENKAYILSTWLTSQWATPFVIELALKNMPSMDVTPLRSGASSASMVRFEHPLNALTMDVQDISPHCVIASILFLSAEVPK